MGIKQNIAAFVCGCMALLSFEKTAMAADPPDCETIRLADVGWTDIQATTALAAFIVRALGYKPEIKQVAVPVAFESLKNRDLDVFLGNWMPSMANSIKPYSEEGSIETIGKNLEGAGYGLVVPNYVAQAGVKDLKDLSAHRDKFDRRIYGIEAGNDGNRIILEMIARNEANLQNFELIESSEAGMLSQAEQAIKDHKWIVFLGWTPHPVMGEMPLTYLTGLDSTGFGSANVYTNVRAGYEKSCPNAGRFFKNLKFSLSMENALMDSILKGTDPEKAAQSWLQKHPRDLERWLEGVTDFKGNNALQALNKKLDTAP